MWRPKDWDWMKIQNIALKKVPVGEHSDEVFIEAGADAVLEALRDARFPYSEGQFAGIEITQDGEFYIIAKG